MTKTLEPLMIDFLQSLRISQPLRTHRLSVWPQELKLKQVCTVLLQIICDGASEGQAAISAGRLFHQANRGGTEGRRELCTPQHACSLIFSPTGTPARWQSPEVCLTLGESTTGGQVATPPSNIPSVGSILSPLFCDCDTIKWMKTQLNLATFPSRHRPHKLK